MQLVGLLSQQEEQVRYLSQEAGGYPAETRRLDSNDQHQIHKLAAYSHKSRGSIGIQFIQILCETEMEQSVTEKFQSFV